jgi:hypothetical protein
MAMISSHLPSRGQCWLPSFLALCSGLRRDYALAVYPAHVTLSFTAEECSFDGDVNAQTCCFVID